MKKNSSLDERQLLVRGDIYKHMFIIMAGLLLLDSCLKNLGVIWVDGINFDIIIATFSAMIGFIEMICRDVYVSMRGGEKIQISLLGIAGVSSLFPILGRLASGKKFEFIVQGKLTNSGSSSITGIFMLVILIAFLAKTFSNKRRESVEQ